MTGLISLNQLNFTGLTKHSANCKKKQKKTEPANTHHFMRNISSPLESVAPIILSGCRPLPKPRAFSPWEEGDQTSIRSHDQKQTESSGYSSSSDLLPPPTSSFFLLLPRSSESFGASAGAFLLPSFFFSSFSFSFCMNSAMRSGQSRLSSGSHVLSSLQAFHFKNLIIFFFYKSRIF